MKTIIAGSRTITGTEGFTAVEAAIKASKFAITEVVSGTANGVDRLGEMWARQVGVPIKEFPADWQEHGKSAGFIRNAEMADYADALIAVWDGVSKGTNHMINIAERKGLKVSITYVTEALLGALADPVIEVPRAIQGNKFLVIPLG